MLTSLAKWLLVITSVAPIVFVYAASLVPNDRELALRLFGVVGVFWAACYGILRLSHHKADHVPKQLTTVSGLEKESLAFLVAYALPVVGAAAKPTETPPVSAALALAAFVIVMAVVVGQQELFYVNPLIAILGYHFFLATRDDGAQVLVLSRRKNISKGEIVVAELSNYLWLDTASKTQASLNSPHTDSG